MSIENCPNCGGTHFGSNECPTGAEWPDVIGATKEGPKTIAEARALLEPANSEEWTERLTEKIEDAYMMLHDIPMSAQVEVGNKIRALLNRAIAEKDAEIARLKERNSEACPACGGTGGHCEGCRGWTALNEAEATIASLRQQLEKANEKLVGIAMTEKSAKDLCAAHNRAIAEKDAEIARLADCLKRANAGMEEYERKYYLENDQVAEKAAENEILHQRLTEYTDSYCATKIKLRETEAQLAEKDAEPKRT